MTLLRWLTPHYVVLCVTIVVAALQDYRRMRKSSNPPLLGEIILPYYTNPNTKEKKESSSSSSSSSSSLKNGGNSAAFSDVNMHIVSPAEYTDLPMSDTFHNIVFFTYVIVLVNMAMETYDCISGGDESARFQWLACTLMVLVVRGIVLSIAYEGWCSYDVLISLFVGCVCGVLSVLAMHTFGDTLIDTPPLAQVAHTFEQQLTNFTSTNAGLKQLLQRTHSSSSSSPQLHFSLTMAQGTIGCVMCGVCALLFLPAERYALNYYRLTNDLSIERLPKGKVRLLPTHLIVLEHLAFISPLLVAMLWIPSMAREPLALPDHMFTVFRYVVTVATMVLRVFVCRQHCRSYAQSPFVVYQSLQNMDSIDSAAKNRLMTYSSSVHLLHYFRVCAQEAGAVSLLLTTSMMHKVITSLDLGVCALVIGTDGVPPALSVQARLAHDASLFHPLYHSLLPSILAFILFAGHCTWFAMTTFFYFYHRYRSVTMPLTSI